MDNNIIVKSRQVGSSWVYSWMHKWFVLHKEYERRDLRKRNIKSIFNI